MIAAIVLAVLALGMLYCLFDINPRDDDDDGQ